MREHSKVAIGNDIVNIPKFAKNLTAAFKKKVFTAREINQIEEYKADPSVRYATTWAAKEAVIKALKQLFGERLGLRWKEIEIVRKGKIPSAYIKKPKYKELSVSLSLSFDQDYAFAVALIN